MLKKAPVDDDVLRESLAGRARGLLVLAAAAFLLCSVIVGMVEDALRPLAGTLAAMACLFMGVSPNAKEGDGK